MSHWQKDVVIPKVCHAQGSLSILVYDPTHFFDIKSTKNDSDEVLDSQQRGNFDNTCGCGEELVCSAS